MIYILTGDIETGKSKALLQWAHGRSDVHGILSPRNENNERYFLNINTKKSFRMLANSEDEDPISIGRYHFLKSAFEKANAIIKKSVEKNQSGYIVIDELGKLEVNSEGLYESAKLAINKALNHPNFHSILVVRTALLSGIVKKYKIGDVVYFDSKQIPIM